MKTKSKKQDIFFSTAFGKKLKFGFAGISTEKGNFSAQQDFSIDMLDSYSRKTVAKGIATKIVAGVVAVALVGTGVGLGYMKQHKKPVKVAEQTKNDKKEKPATTEEKTSEKFVLTEEQIREIKVAAALFDNCFASYNTESGDRIEYSTPLDQDHISPKVLKVVARGWACTDENMGEDLGDSYEEDDISSYVSRKYMKTDECQEFLKDTFGYEAE